jgi:hypothetical protein
MILETTKVYKQPTREHQLATQLPFYASKSKMVTRKRGTNIFNCNAQIYLKNSSHDPQITSNKELPTVHHAIHPHLQPHSGSALFFVAVRNKRLSKDNSQYFKNHRNITVPRNERNQE